MTTFVCDMSWMTSNERQQHISAIEELFRTVQEVKEFGNGYVFRLKNEERILLQSTASIAKEQRCCPFFHFNIDVEANEASFWLNLTGPEGTKPFIQMEIGESFADEAARKAGFHTIEKQAFRKLF